MLVSEFEKATMYISAKERAQLVEPPEVAAAWNREIEARLLVYERGELESFSAESVFARPAETARLPILGRCPRMGYRPFGLQCAKTSSRGARAVLAVPASPG